MTSRPSEPKIIPIPRKISSAGTPYLVDSLLVTILINKSKATTNRVTDRDIYDIFCIY
jgi:hypothetical protein